MTDTTKDRKTPVDEIHFGTDGWRAIIDEDFNLRSAARVADAAARVFAQDSPGGTILIGYDTRKDAGRYGALVACVVAAHGLSVQLSNTYCPTPTLCWSVARNDQACGGFMLTSSHNPAEYLGIKLRMIDGGASPASFTNRVEQALDDDVPASFEQAKRCFEAATSGTPDDEAQALEDVPYRLVDLVNPYLDDLCLLVDADAIAHAGLRVVVDPLYGAGRGYLAGVLTRLGVEVVEVNGADDPTFDGLHPEPIPPWIERGAKKVVELGYDACFVTDGDADRIGAIDARGTFINPHRILTLAIAHLVENRGLTGRVVRTLSGSTLLARQCERLGLELVTKPIGFKWIYEEMLAGDVLIGGEESGGIGIPTHVRERDGLLMALLLAELMAKRGKPLATLVEDMFSQLGRLEYTRRDLQIEPQQKEVFLSLIGSFGAQNDAAACAEAFGDTGEVMVAIDRRDGLKIDFASGAWLLMRPSGTEPLVRVYAEAESMDKVNDLLDCGCALVQG